MRKGNEVVISVGSGEKTCPVKVLRRYLTEVERYPVQSDHFVFRALSKCKSGHKLVAINGPVSYSTIREYFKLNFKDIVPDISLFSTHSLRAGVPEEKSKVNPRDLVRSTEKRVQEFWHCWLKYFAPDLLPRNKWYGKRKNLSK